MKKIVLNYGRMLFLLSSVFTVARKYANDFLVTCISSKRFAYRKIKIMLAFKKLTSLSDFLYGPSYNFGNTEVKKYDLVSI